MSGPREGVPCEWSMRERSMQVVYARAVHASGPCESGPCKRSMQAVHARVVRESGLGGGGGGGGGGIHDVK